MHYNIVFPRNVVPDIPENILEMLEMHPDELINCAIYSLVQMADDGSDMMEVVDCVVTDLIDMTDDRIDWVGSTNLFDAYITLVECLKPYITPYLKGLDHCSIHGTVTDYTHVPSAYICSLYIEPIER